MLVVVSLESMLGMILMLCLWLCVFIFIVICVMCWLLWFFSMVFIRCGSRFVGRLFM